MRVRKPKKNKKKLQKKKKRVPKKIFYYDSDEGSEERVFDWENYFSARGYCSDPDKTM